MNEVTLPPSPNWYLSNILACSRRGTVAWGSKNFIVVAKRNDNDDTLQYSLIKDNQTDKITAVAFRPASDGADNLDTPELLIAGGDDDSVKVWNVDTLELAMEYSFNVREKTTTVTGIGWSAKDTNLAYAVNSEGFLMYCNIHYQNCRVIPLGKVSATCLACCPHDSNLLAVGLKGGLIYIMQKETILYKLRGHNEDVVSLSWCPSDVNVLSGNEKRDLLLASGAKDRCVFIWKARDGRYETVIHIPVNPLAGSTQHKSKLAVNGTWIAVCWPEPKMLLTGSHWGELLSWDLAARDDKGKYAHKLAHSYHGRGLFCIVVEPRDEGTSGNWRVDPGFTIWTLAQDRWIVCCKQYNDPAKPTVLRYQIPTQGGFVYCMEACAIDTSRIAFGVGDTMLRLWNLSESHTTTFDVTMYWQKIKGKIRALSWFPEDESTVAFATSEGRVGVFEAIGTQKLPVLYRQYHRNTVYKIEWAKLDDSYYVFSCADRELIAHKKSTPDDEPRIIKKGCKEFSWKSNLCLAIALENGSIVFYDEKLRQRGNVIHVLRNTVNRLAWHPDSTASDTWTSPMANYLAIASDSSSIMIFDMSELMRELKDTSADCIPSGSNDEHKIQKPVATLTAHSERVVCLAWSPHFSGLLVSGSYDHTAQVWNVEKQELIGTYADHDGPVMSCMWSPFKPQLIVTGSSDFTLRIWDYTSPKQSPRQSVKQKKKKKGKDKMKDTETQKNPTSASTTDPVVPSKVTSKVAEPKLEASAPRKKDKRTYLSKYHKGTDRLKIVDFIRDDIRRNQRKEEEEEEEGGDAASPSLFCEKPEDLAAFLAKRMSEQETPIAAAELSVWWNGHDYGHDISLESRLMAAAKENQLNDYLVSLAPSVSARMWKEMCEAYAHQLIKQRNAEKAVSYLLCVHKIYDAIDTLLLFRMHKEAYLLARCRLDADDLYLRKVLTEWAEWAAASGVLEEAAHCYVKLEQYDKAAEALARRIDLSCLEVASELAFMSGDEKYGISIAVDAMTRALGKSMWQKARSLIENIRPIQYLNVYIDVHEAIMSEYGKRTELEVVRTLCGDAEETESPGVFRALRKVYDPAYYDALRKNAATITEPRREMTDMTKRLESIYTIAVAATCDTKEARLRHIAMALDTALRCTEKIKPSHVDENEVRFFIYLLASLDIRKSSDKDDIYAKSGYPVSESVRAYLCVGLLDWLLDNPEGLSLEDETRVTEAILDLLDDAVNEEVLSYRKKISELSRLENQLMASLMDSDVEMKMRALKACLSEKIEDLKSAKSKFEEERVCTPNPAVVFHKVCEVANRLRDSNKSRFLCHLGKLINLVKTDSMELEWSLDNVESLIEKLDKTTLENNT